MGEFVVRGRRRLTGTVRVNGAKNAALPIMAATVLASRPVLLHDVPDLRDIRVMSQVLQALGAEVERQGSDIFVDPRTINNYVVPAELMQEMRASIFLLGPLLARLGAAEATQPGGCAIGQRPIDLHLYALGQLGARICDEDGRTVLRAERLRGNEVHFPFPSVGATENVLMAAAMAEGETRIRNAAMEPEIVDLAQFLEKLGATVRGAGTPDIRVTGNPHLGTTEHTIIGDRIEAATFILAVAATGGDIVVQNCMVDHLPGLWTRLKELGVIIEELDAETVRVVSEGVFKPCPVSIATAPYPGFATDLQPQFMSFLLQVPGVHLITERVFENRLGHTIELRRLGAQIVADQRVALIYGGHPLHGTVVTAPDLRAGAALVNAALIAEGETVIRGREVIERGYENLDYRLRSLGADIVAR
ncbi:UDP-N-acetylglucosamine 1-carboxyvinyltransferase [Sulfobacillus thermosulfidooxidans]|uniref:UDP-N-acetylglucosamine 1-carboxyvinyltransferase n=1 Tax=Sulfobacillus thermosulfidooxidans TaxID=28034 RepID=UPI0006B5CE59|nr:UDP-N-acetylglucosamine 1-carboxyvinyltransferase [Sulfobacillus thermosulfidooxidans]